VKITAEQIYALNIMLSIPILGVDGPISCTSLEKRMGINKDYLRPIAKKLEAAKLLKCSKYHGRGYSLARPTAEITVKQVLEAVGGSTTLHNSLTNCKNLVAYNTEYGCISAFLNMIDTLLGDALNTTIETLIFAKRTEQMGAVN